jgi:hypothetical protein
MAAIGGRQSISAINGSGKSPLRFAASDEEGGEAVGLKGQKAVGDS